MIIPLILLLLLLSHTVFLALMLMGAVMKRRPADHWMECSEDTLPGISIVIPFKNEAGNLARLLASLAAQKYNGKYEVILINDSSTDNYNSVIQAVTCTMPLKVLDSVFAPLRRLTSKQQALDLGIKSASFDWIAFTDADMVLDPEWLNSFARSAANGARLVFGHTAIMNGAEPGLLSWFQSFQLELLFSVAWALSRIGIAGSCMGNNLLVSKQAYLSIGGYDAIGYTIVEDRALLSAFAGNRLPIAATDAFRPTAVTLPCSSLGQYSQQLLRWAYGGFGWKANLTLFAIPQVCQTLLFIAALSGALPALPSEVAIFNFFASWGFYALAFRRMRSSERAVFYPVFFVLLLIETVWLIAAFIIRRPVSWKGRHL